MNFFQKTVARLLGKKDPSLVFSIHAMQMEATLLKRSLNFDVYLPPGYAKLKTRSLPLVLFNDGQDLSRMHFTTLLNRLYKDQKLPRCVLVGIHCAEQRMREYGTVSQPDYKGRGDLAPQYARFLLEEFLPHVRTQFKVSLRPEKTVLAGFSLGGLTAFDITWANPKVFGVAGVFSGALWWRSREVDPKNPDNDRIIHDVVAHTAKTTRTQRFWFQCGSLDETEDRNHNGVIDAIDDTLDLMRALHRKGIPDKHVRYVELENGTHDPATWAKAMPDFLSWALAKK